jgi:D-glycero-D-manno-heptose 1,7-bisphosphate phosphatase
MRKAVFLDRDGVVTRSVVRDGRPFAPTTLDDFEVLPGVLGSLTKLREAGFLNFVVTNQPDIATGKQSLSILAEMHDRLHSALDIDAIKVCTHVDADACQCRKPRAGMLFDLAREWRVDLKASWLVGDRWRDIEAGQAAGCRCCFIDYGYKERQPTLPFFLASSLPDATDLILRIE